MMVYRMGLIAILPLVVALLATGCDRNPEHRKTLENLNSHADIIARGGTVKKVEMQEPRGGVYEFEGDILDPEGTVIGRVRGARVEGFGTRIGRIRWADADGNIPEGGERRRRGGDGQRGAEGERARERQQRDGAAESPPVEEATPAEAEAAETPAAT